MKTRTLIAILIFVLAVLIITGSCVPTPEITDERGDISQETFFQAVKSGNYAEVERLIEEGVDVNFKDNYGRTVLMYATLSMDETLSIDKMLKKHSEIVKLLIDAGADVNAKDNEGVTALMYASLPGRTAIVKLLIEEGADVNAQSNDGYTALMTASAIGQTDIAHLLIEEVADVNAKNKKGYTALMYASQNGHTDIAHLLIEAGAKQKELQKNISEDITIIYVDDQSIQHYGSLPWTRDKYAKFINAIYEKYSPKAVFIDIIFDLPSKETPELDKVLFESIKGKKNLVFCSTISDNEVKEEYYIKQAFPKSNVKNSTIFRSKGGYLPLPEIINSGGEVGIAAVGSDKNGLYKYFLTLIQIENSYFLSTSVKLLMLYKDIPQESIQFLNNELIIGYKKLLLDTWGRYEVNFYFGFKKFSYLDIINREVDSKYIDKKIILLGANATGINAYYPTSENLRFEGTEYLACSIQTLLEWYKNR